ncbi:aldose 1-epimerase [Cupriavidus sp. RAF12]|uniref:aldose 1-epimerase n=1 Tax=Cupriavidus sp. RAF12 TaxID=3233050 RepID=UPI003F8FEF73
MRQTTGGVWLEAGPVHTLRAGPHTLAVAPAAGGRMASLTTSRADGAVIEWLAPMPAQALREGFDAHAWPKAGLYPLLPFSNRIRNGRFRWNGQDIVLPAHPGQAHAMHGFGHVRPWQVVHENVDAITLELRHVPAPGDWPWPVFARQSIVLSPEGLVAELVVRNDGDSAMPVGGGFHPFFARVPGMRVQFDAAHLWPADHGGVATGRAAVGDRERFLRERNLPEADFSIYYSGWKRQVTLRRPDGATLLMRAGEGLDHLVLHAPAGCDYVCLEPVSHVADAVNLAARGWEGAGLRALAAGESVVYRMLWRIDLPA